MVHLLRYLGEQASRYNERKHDRGDGGRLMFLSVLVADMTKVMLTDAMKVEEVLRS